jgi:hypothetical protein
VRLEVQLVNCSVKGRQNANAMFKSVSFGFTNSSRFVLVLLLRAFRSLMKLSEIANAASNLVALLYAIWDPDVGTP